MLDGLHPAAADPVARRHHAARTADRPVLQDRAERSVGGARRPQLPVPGVPGQARARPFSCAATRRATCRSAATRGAVRRCRTAAHRSRPAEHHAAEQVPVHPAGGGPRPGPAGGAVAAGRGAGTGPGAERAVPAAGAAERQRAAAAAGRSTRRRTRSCRRTAGRRRRRPLRRRRRAAMPPLRRRRRRCPPRRHRWPVVADYATYDQNGKFVDPAGGTGVFAGGTDKLAPAENWVDLMLAPRQA